jgi:hypothetical protein
MLLTLIIVVAALIGATGGAALARYFITVRSLTARERANYAAAIDLLSDLTLNPDARTLRDSARTIIDTAAQSALRKDT